jgi:sulfatase maturation enzyme AslB (radical SAM superfamily)
LICPKILDAKNNPNKKTSEENKIVLTKDFIKKSINDLIKNGEKYVIELKDPDLKLFNYKNSVIELKKIKEILKKLIKEADEKKAKLYFRGIPICIIPFSEIKKDRMLQPDTLKLNGKKIDYIELAEELTKSVRIKPLKCCSCIFYNKCPGVYLQYFRLFGSSGLKPGLVKEIRINLDCNQKCLFCNTDKNAENVILKTEKIINQITKWRKENVLGLIISGKEPTLNPDLSKIINKARSLGYLHIELQTNAIILKEIKTVKNLAKNGLNSAFVPIHAHNDTLSTKITGVKGSFNDTIKGIKNLIKGGVEVSINIVVNSMNYKYLKDIVKFIFDSFIKGNKYSTIKQLFFSYVAPVCLAWKNKEVIPKFSIVKPYFEEAIELCKSYGMSFEIPARCGVPLCFLGNNMIYSAEYKRPLRWHNEHAKSKIKLCEQCLMNNSCSGLWDNYIKLYGTKEIKPIYNLPAVRDTNFQNFEKVQIDKKLISFLNKIGKKYSAGEFLGFYKYKQHSCEDTSLIEYQNKKIIVKFPRNPKRKEIEKFFIDIISKKTNFARIISTNFYKINGKKAFKWN